MATLFLLALTLLVSTICGLGPALLLCRDVELRSLRLISAPIVGICSATLVTIFLAQFGLTGRSIAFASLTFFGILTCISLRKACLRLEELRKAIPVFIVAAGTLSLVAWPLVRAGYDNYWGFANPDHAFHIGIFGYLQNHAFHIPTPEEAGRLIEILGVEVEGYRNPSYGTEAILGIVYFCSMISVLSGVPVELLFSVTSAAVVFLIPLSVLVLCELGLHCSRKVALTISAFTALSSLLALTFYLHSLGALITIALLPFGFALSLAYFEKPHWTRAVQLIIVCAAAYYAYYPSFSVLGVVIAGQVLGGLIRRKYSLRRVAVLGSIF